MTAAFNADREIRPRPVPWVHYINGRQLVLDSQELTFILLDVGPSMHGVLGDVGKALRGFVASKVCSCTAETPVLDKF